MKDLKFDRNLRNLKTFNFFKAKIIEKKKQTLFIKKIKKIKIDQNKLEILIQQIQLKFDTKLKNT